MDKKAIIFIGRSGSGKGTQVKLLQDLMNANNEPSLYVGTGDHFRKIMQSNDYTAQMIKRMYDEGARPYDFLLVTLLGNIFRFDYKEGQSVLIDGGARSLREAQIIMEILDFYHFKEIKVVYLNVSYEWSVDKLLKRGREDDNVAAFEEKNKWFNEDVMAAIEFFRANEKVKFLEINGERSIEEVHGDIVSKI